MVVRGYSSRRCRSVAGELRGQRDCDEADRAAQQAGRREGQGTHGCAAQIDAYGQQWWESGDGAEKQHPGRLAGAVEDLHESCAGRLRTGEHRPQPTRWLRRGLRTSAELALQPGRADRAARTQEDQDLAGSLSGRGGHPERHRRRAGRRRGRDEVRLGGGERQERGQEPDGRGREYGDHGRVGGMSAGNLAAETNETTFTTATPTAKVTATAVGV